MSQNNDDYPREAFFPLLPITSTQSLNEIFQAKLEFHSMKDFKQKQQIPLILNNNESDKQFLSNIHLQLECLSQSADEIYSQFITEKPKNM
ncbi:unnamed protein product [Rotaria sp. Silwood2]|nr:unnamed protein product [Rotaria sp. Silwood2]